jgi:hypothetical protein
MAKGNKFNNGVWEQGTPEIVLAYQHDTPGQKVEEYVEGLQLQNEKKKLNAKKQFTQVFDNPLKGFPYNEEFEVKEIKEETVSENADMVIHVDDKLQTNLVTKMASKFGLTSKKTKISWSGKDGVVVSGDANKLKKFMSSVENVFKEETITEIKQQEVDALKKLSKEMQSVLKGYQKIAKMGDKELTNTKYNKDYEAVLKSRDTILQLIGKVNTQKILNKEEIVNSLEEDYKKVIKMFPRDNDWKKLITKHRRAIDDFRNNNKDLPSKVEDELLTWASQTGEVSGKHDAEDFILDILDEKFKPYMPRGYERVTDMYIQFRGNGEEKDFAKAKKMVMDYSKKHKLDIKDNPRNKVFGTPQEGSSAYKISLFAKFTKDENHDLAPLYKQLATLKTAEDHGGGNAEPIKENYRTAARHGMGTEGKKEARVGLELDYYDKTGTKYMGKIVKKDSKGYTVKDDKSGKMHTFVYHDRIKARKFLQKVGEEGDNMLTKLKISFKEDTLKEGTMAIGIKDRDPKERAKAQAQLKVMLKKIGNKKVGSKEGQDFDDKLDYDILSDDILADEFANPKNKNMKVKDLLKKHAKRLNVNFDESVEEEEVIVNETVNYHTKISNINIANAMKNNRMLKKYVNVVPGSGTSDTYEIASLLSKKMKKFGFDKKEVKAIEDVMQTAFATNESVEEGNAESRAQQAAIAISKKQKEKNESVMNTYRNVWEETLQEEMITYRVKKMQRPEEDKFKRSAKMMGLKITMDKGRDDTVIVMSGTKKKLRDFDAIARGKSSFGDPSTITHFDEK